MKYIIIYIISLILLIVGLISWQYFLIIDFCWYDIKMFISYTIAYFIIIRPVINYWFVEIQKILLKK